MAEGCENLPDHVIHAVNECPVCRARAVDFGFCDGCDAAAFAPVFDVGMQVVGEGDRDSRGWYAAVVAVVVGAARDKWLVGQHKANG